MKVRALAVACAMLSALVAGCSDGPQGCDEHATAGAAPGDAPRFTIPFEMLEPYWNDWREHAVGGTLGLYMRKGDVGTVVGVITDGLDTLALDGYGQIVPPTTAGSVFFFETDGLPCGWLNKLLIQTDGRVSFEVVEGKGLVHVSGEGLCTLADGTVAKLE